jgi:rubrerythrin
LCCGKIQFLSGFYGSKTEVYYGVNTMSIKGSQTEKNLLRAFAGESQARNRYTYFASVAQKAGLVKIAKVFTETAEQEKEHAKRFFSFLEGGNVEITAMFPAGIISTTVENLTAAANGEFEEHSVLYPEFAKVAYQEGFETVAEAFEFIAIAECQHEKQFRALAKKLENNMVFRADTTVNWRCLNCGYVCESVDAPKVCPACAHPQAYFEILYS